MGQLVSRGDESASNTYRSHRVILRTGEVMRLVSRGGLIAIAFMVGALAAPTVQASSSAGSFNDPAST